MDIINVIFLITLTVVITMIVIDNKLWPGPDHDNVTRGFRPRWYPKWGGLFGCAAILFGIVSVLRWTL